MTAVTEGQPWKITQLGPPYRVLQLAGWAAPFGGPRAGAVVRTPVAIRAERTYYPGSKTPTRHIFGEKFPDWELRGRFRDRARPPYGGTGFAKAKTEEVLSFVRDQQLVSIGWGDILFAAQAFIVEFDPGWEAAREVEWVMKIEIDAQSDAAARIAERSFAPPADYTAKILSSLQVVEAAVKRPELPGDLFEILDSLVSSLAGAVGQVATAADQIRAFKDGTFGQLNRLQSSLATLGRASRTARETFVTIPLDALTFRDNADASIELLASQVTVEEQLMEMEAQAAEMDRASHVAKAGRATTSYAARTGDTWEAISSQFYGRPDRVGDIRVANDVDAGQNPVPGVEYLIPA